jgi:hypothetical protein
MPAFHLKRFHLPNNVCLTACLALSSIGLAGTMQQPIPKRITRTEQRRLNAASSNYKRHHDYQSLLLIFQYLHPGMSQNEVEALLGAPDYSPIDGQYYYGSQANCSCGEDEPSAPCGVVIMYQPHPTLPTLESCWFGAIRE